MRFCCFLSRALLYFPCKINSPSASCTKATRSFPDRFSLGSPHPPKKKENMLFPMHWRLNDGSVSRLQPSRALTFHSQALTKNQPQPPIVTRTHAHLPSPPPLPHTHPPTHRDVSDPRAINSGCYGFIQEKKNKPRSAFHSGRIRRLAQDCAIHSWVWTPCPQIPLKTISVTALLHGYHGYHAVNNETTIALLLYLMVSVWVQWPWCTNK